MKIIVPFRSNPMRNWNIQKNSQKIKKIKKHYYEFISMPNRMEKDKKERK